MKLLIVDDEELTRNGVISSIDWTSLGISQVLQADDGIHGLEAALKYRPEIILCDVRMPRMDGISMLERLEQELPDTVSIFMSGYSDKEYLKAAIKLRAVNYIEKPLNPDEIREAVAEARELYLKKIHSRRGETIHSMETASRLALQLTVPSESSTEAIEELCRELSLHISPGTYFTALIIRMDVATEPADEALREIHEEFQEFLKKHHFDCLYVKKRVQHLVYFVYGPSRPSPVMLQTIGEFLNSRYQVFGRHYISAGDTFSGIFKAYQSYASAVILLQSSYFFPENAFLISSPEKEPSKGKTMPSDPENSFSEALSSKNHQAALRILDTLKDYFENNRSILPNQARDLYYKLFLSLISARKQMKITGSISPADENISDTMEHCFSFCELHQVLSEKTELFFRDVDNSTEENPTIFLIKDYISKNYSTETLSVKDISSHVFLSASYVCTFFKNETGQTLNQYITEYRMERAKQLLEDSRYKISDISSRVGYSDGNYFGKSFKKYTGLSPSEYREKMLK